jgi:Na+-driven multidrug efflux pump
MINAFNGSGDTMTPTLINFICFWLIEIPVAYLLAMVIGIGPRGVYWSIVIAESTAGWWRSRCFEEEKERVL